MGKFSPSNTSTPDLEVDDGTLSVDETNNRVGIGVTDPDHKLEVAGPIHISGETTTPSQPAGGDGGVLYVKTDGKIYWRSNEISETDLTSGGGGGGSTAADDIAAGDAAVNIKTTSGAINIGHADNDEAINIGSGGTGAIQIGHSTTTSVTVDAVAVVVDSADTIDIDSADEITIDTTSADGHIAVTSAHTAGQSILISANANAGSILDIDAGILDIDVQAGTTLNTTGLTITDTTTTSATEGGAIRLVADDGAVMADNHRLGVIEFAGAEDTSNTISVGARIQAICRDAWDGSNNDADLEFYTTNGTTESLVLTLDADKLATFKGSVTLGDAETDVTTITGQLTASAGLHLPNGAHLGLGNTNPGHPLVVTATDANTTSGIIAQFEGPESASEVNRIVINATTSGKDAGLSFMNAGSSKWTIGNDGSDDSFHIAVGYPSSGFAATDALTISTAGEVVITGDLTGSQGMLIPDNGVLRFGDDSEVTLSHVHNSGLTLTHTATGDDSTATLTLATMEGAIEQDDVIGKLAFQPIGETGTDAITVAAAIQATAEAAFDADENATKMEFMLGVSGAAATKMTLSSAGVVTATGGFTVGTNVITDDSIVMTPSTDDTVTIAAATNGALNITTVDNAAHGADLTLTVDGDTIMLAEGKPVARAVGTATSSTTNIANAFSFVRPVLKVTADTQLYAGDSGALVMFNDTAATITLPDSGTAANLGTWFTFVVVDNSAGTKKIVMADTSNERFAGLIKLIDTDSSNAISFKAAAGAANVSITFNGSTTGTGGSAVTIVATAADEWTVIDSNVLVTGDPSSVSPFGTS